MEFELGFWLGDIGNDHVEWAIKVSESMAITASTPSVIQDIMLNCIHIFIVTGSFLY